MSIDLKEVEKIAHLARLAIDDADAPKYAQDLSAILNFIAQMKDANTNNIEPMANPLHATQRLREDQVTETDERTLFQSGAPATEAGLYLVPKVIEGEEE